jgi:type IV pilus assembly protein PilB
LRRGPNEAIILIVLKRGKHAMGSGGHGAEEDVTPAEGRNGDEPVAVVKGDASVEVALEPIPGLLGDLLVQRHLISPAHLADALLRQAGSGERVGTLLVKAGAVDERRLTDAIAEHLGLPVVDLRVVRPEADALKTLPEHVARELQAVPLARDGDAVTIVVADPGAPGLADRLAHAVGGPVDLAIAPPSDIRRVINASYSALAGVGRYVQAFQAAESLRRTSAGGATVEAPAETAPVVQVVNMIITQALRDRASDVHIEPQDDRMRIRVRTDGALHDALSLPADMGPALISRIKIMAGMNIVERRRSQDGQFTTEIDGRSLDVRVATTATIWGEKCVLRLLDKTRSLFQLHELGMPDDTSRLYSRLIRSPFGMVLCAGPTGSGKTTTLYATLSEINESHRNIMTIEDPVEYVFPSINQIQTNESAGLTFADGLKSILRQDPDIILVGEIRDVETARIAVQSALTGHLVLSSLHATDTAAALHRFLDMGIESFLIASSVIAVVAQRLMRRICQSCMAPHRPTDEELAFYEEAGGPPKDVFYAGRGCNFCAGTGYMDRIGVFEVMRITPELKRLIVGWATQDELRRLAVSQGMRTLRDDAIALVADDVTTISEVIRGIYAL